MASEIEAARAAELRQEALSIHEGGLLALLEREFGLVNIAGNVALDLMTWPEADGAPKMQRLVDEPPGHQGYLLAHTILYNEHLLLDPKFPAPYGLYDGSVFLHGESRRPWKLDFWGGTTAGRAEQQARNPNLRCRLQTADRDLILRPKTAEGYGKEFAIAKARRSVEELKAFVREQEMSQRKP